jgi:hypothetical protein
MDDWVRPSSLICTFTQLDAEKPREEALGETDAKAALQTLDRFTQEEARSRAAEILQVVHGLVKIMRAAMEGEQTLLS